MSRVGWVSGGGRAAAPVGLGPGAGSAVVEAVEVVGAGIGCAVMAGRGRGEGRAVGAEVGVGAAITGGGAAWGGGVSTVGASVVATRGGGEPGTTGPCAVAEGVGAGGNWYEPAFCARAPVAVTAAAVSASAARVVGKCPVVLIMEPGQGAGGLIVDEPMGMIGSLALRLRPVHWARNRRASGCAKVQSGAVRCF